MRWEDERYVRVYTRDTPDWVALGWEAQAVFLLLLRKCDRAGLVDLGRSGDRGLAVMLGVPADVVQRSLAVLVEDGCVVRHEGRLVVRNFVAAQEATMSNKAKCRAYRERVAADARGLTPDVSPSTPTVSVATPKVSSATPNDTPYRTVPSVPYQDPLALTLDGAPARPRKATRPPKHTPEEIANKALVVSAFEEAFLAKKAVKPESITAGDHAAAFTLAKRYGAGEAGKIIARAFEDPFVVDRNATLRFIASKADSYRGTPSPKSNGVHPAVARADEDSARHPSRAPLRLASRQREAP